MKHIKNLLLYNRFFDKQFRHEITRQILLYRKNIIIINKKNNNFIYSWRIDTHDINLNITNTYKHTNKTNIISCNDNKFVILCTM